MLYSHGMVKGKRQLPLFCMQGSLRVNVYYNEILQVNKAKPSLSRNLSVGCRIGGAETRYNTVTVAFDRILQRIVLPVDRSRA